MIRNNPSHAVRAAKSGRPVRAVAVVARALASVLALVAVHPAFAAPDVGPDPRQALPECLRLAAEAPDAGFEKALVWEDKGGGDAARECQAMALFHRGQFQEAGIRLAALAPKLDARDPAVAANLYLRAGWAWLRAGRPAEADTMFTEALNRRPDDPEIYIDRAFAREELERYWDVVDDLTEAIARAPDRADIYIYRAEAYRALGNLGLAAGDLGEALERDPANPDALLLRGNVRALDGDVERAMEDWRRVLRLDPDTPAAHAAEDNIARAEIGAGGDARPVSQPVTGPAAGPAAGPADD